ncbi:MAG: hypothetical protein M0Z95_21160 [Actinomycetota bacterium]|jgi:hypothetical protein|nr:hypothetical protein [Actinomycetota bacterium]
MSATTNGSRITRDDLEAAFARVLGDGETTARSAAPVVLSLAGAALVGTVALAYLIGRRRGRRHSTILELRRI